MNDVEVLTPAELDFVVPDGYESLDGRLVELPMSRKSSWIGGQIFFLLQTFCLAHPIGRVYPADTAFRCFPNRPRHVRKPDVAFVRAEREPAELTDGDFRIPPDLVVEVLSPTETAQDLNAKIKDYRSVSVPLIWVVDPSARTVQVVRADGTGRLMTDADALDGENVLPGFTCRVADFLAPVTPA